MDLSDYIDFEDGKDYIIDSSNGVRFACCDCGLVHDFHFELLPDGLMVFRMTRNVEETERVRAQGGFEYDDKEVDE